MGSIGGFPLDSQQQQQELASFLGASSDGLPSGGGMGDGAGGHSGSSSPGGGPSSPESAGTVLNFLRERGVNPDEYGWRDDASALAGLYDYLRVIAGRNRQYEMQLAQLQNASGKAGGAAGGGESKPEEEPPKWERMPKYDPTWRYRQNDPAALEELAAYAAVLQERNHRFHDDPIGYLREQLDHYLKPTLKSLREEIEKKIEEGLRSVRYESQLPWFIEDRRNLFFDKNGTATKYNEAYMDVFNSLVNEQGYSRDLAMQKAEDIVNRVWTRAVESVVSGSGAAGGGESKADAIRRKAVERHNRVPNRNGSEPRSRVDGPQNPRLDTRKRHEIAYDKFFANGGK